MDREISSVIKEERDLLRHLNDMGFTEADTNLTLIRKHKGNLERIVGDLI